MITSESLRVVVDCTFRRSGGGEIDVVTNLRLFELGLDDGLDIAKRQRHRIRADLWDKSARFMLFRSP